MTKSVSEQTEGGLEGRLLIAMPQMDDSLFKRSIIYLIEHNQAGSNGLIVNRASSTSFRELFSDLNIDCNSESVLQRNCCIGGPLAMHRGFVMYRYNDSMKDFEEAVSRHHEMAITGSRQILYRIAEGQAPEQSMIFFGFCGWQGGQLEDELHRDQWLVCPADYDLLFEVPMEQRWQRAMDKLGVDPGRIYLCGDRAVN